MKNLTIGVHILGRDAPSLVDRILAADRAGLDVAWQSVGGVAPDPFVVFAAAAARAARIEFGAAVVPTYPRHPLALAQSAMAIDQIAPGRLRLGVGPSHKPAIQGTWGLPFDSPHTHLREYLIILNAILKEGNVSFHGEILHAEAQIPAPTQVRVMASALRPKAFRLCGELADGAISWLCPLSYIRDVAAPALREGASQTGRPPPAMIVHAPVVVSQDADAVLSAVRRQFAFYPRLPYYSRMLQQAGFPEAAAAEFTDAMARALVIFGSADQVAQRLAELPGYGVDELLASIVLLPDDPQPAVARTLALLGELAQAH